MPVKISTHYPSLARPLPGKRQGFASRDTRELRFRTAAKGMGRGIVGLALLLIWGMTQAAESQSHLIIQETAKAFLEDRLQPTTPDYEIQLGRLDPRLRLRPCNKPLEAYLPQGARLYGKLSVGIRCSDETPWNIYLSANVLVYKDVLTANRPISRGDTVTRQDMQPVRLEISKLNTGYYVDAKNLEGMIARRTIPAGRAFTPNALRAPLLVQRGEEVTLLAGNGHFNVRVKGKALQDAAKGDVVAVRNTRSKRVVEGIAIEPGLVQVRM